MGMTIEVDVDKLKELLNENKIELTNNIISIVRENYIPKANYEIRLKADMVAMLTDIQLEIEEQNHKGSNCYRDGYTPYSEGLDDCKDIIQQKINALKAESEGKE